MKIEMTSEAALLVTRVSGQVDQFPQTKSLNSSNERNRIRSNEILIPTTAIEHRHSKKLQLHDHVTAERVNSCQKPLEIKKQYTSQLSHVFYDQVHLQLQSSRQRRRRERTHGGEPARRSSLPAEKKTKGMSSSTVESHFRRRTISRLKPTYGGSIQDGEDRIQ